MKKQTISFVVNKTASQIVSIGKATILQPKVNYIGKDTKWFNDSKAK